MIDSLISTLQNQLIHLKRNIQHNESGFQYCTLEIALDKSISLHPNSMNNSFFLSRPDSGLIMLSAGSLFTIETTGEQRFKDINTTFSKIQKQWYQSSQSDSIHPLAFLAFAFDENDPMKGHWAQFPNTLLNIPIVLFKQNHSSQRLLVNIKLDQDNYNSTFATIRELLKPIFNPAEKPYHTYTQSDAPLKIKERKTNDSMTQKESWLSLVDKGIHKIQSGHFDKLVTSRTTSLQTTRNISIPHLIQNLIKHYPSCTTISYHHSDENSCKTIVTASPEQLLKLQHPDIYSDALGGTISSNLSSDDSSTNLPFFLRLKSEQTEKESSESKKLLKEHHFISQTIYQNLDPLCHTLKMPVSPYLIKLHNLYHLETPIQGKLMDKYDLFDTIDVLHPTPAVAGLPTQSAKKWLLENENYHRGWYTGALGWIDGNKNGELSVMLRCALIHSNKRQLELFSGAGLVAESSPDAEWQETELKMQTILQMLYL